MKSLSPVARARALLLGVVAAVALAGCGGGSAPIQPFAPTRMVAFGDETSLILGDGRKYSINAAGAAQDCSSNPIWLQALSAHYGMVFAQCNPNNQAAPQARTFAQLGARVDDVRAQVDRFLSSDSFDANTLVTLYAGANDILALYAQYPAQSEAALTAQAGQAGTLLGQQFIRIAKANGRPIVVSLIDMGATPFALRERSTHPDTDRAALMSRLTEAFNNGLYQTLGGANGLNDGRQGALAFGDDMMQSIVKYPQGYGFSNITDPACYSQAPLPTCSTATLVPGATITTWLWADDTRLGPAGHTQLGNIALARALRNPL